MANPQKPVIYRPGKVHPQNSAYPPSIRSALAILQSLHLPAYCQSTPLHRLFWRRGIRLAPPILAGGFPYFFFFGGVFCGVGVGGGGGFSSLSWRMILCGSAAVAIIGGLIVACRYREWRAEYNLPSWREIWQSPQE